MMPAPIPVGLMAGPTGLAPPVLTVTPAGRDAVDIDVADQPDVTSWTIYRAGTSTVVGTINDPPSTLTDSGRAADTEYCYEGVAHAEGDSARSAPECATTWPTAPGLQVEDAGNGYWLHIDTGTDDSTTMTLQRQRNGLWSDLEEAVEAGTDFWEDVPAPGNTQAYRIKFNYSGAPWTTVAVPES